MRLVHTTQYYWPFIGGAENYCQAISEGLASDHEVAVYTTDVISVNPLIYASKVVELKNRVRINRLSSRHVLAGIYGRKGIDGGRIVFFRALSSIDRQLTWPQALLARVISSSVPHMFLWLRERLNEADVIVSFNIITGMTSLSYSASLLNKKKPFVIFPFYHVGLSTFERPSLFKILRDATLVICSTNFERQTLINRGLDSRKLRVVNEGVRNPLVDVAAVHRIEEILDRREGQLLLMYVGRRDYDKGYSHVLSAVSQLVRSGVSIKLVVCGQGKPCANGVDYLFLSTRNAIIDLEVADERTKVAAMSLSDVVVLPSRAETYPLAFVESWLLGKPVIGARIGSVSSMVKEGVDGLLVEFGDVPGLIATIKSLYNNPEKRIEMGKNGQTRARKELTLEKNIARIRKIFNEISGQGLQID